MNLSRAIVNALEGLDLQHTMHFLRLEKADFEKPSRERQVALRLMGRKNPIEGQLGISNSGTYIFSRGTWRLVGTNKKGKHVIVRRARNGK